MSFAPARRADGLFAESFSMTLLVAGSAYLLFAPGCIVATAAQRALDVFSIAFAFVGE